MHNISKFLFFICLFISSSGYSQSFDSSEKSKPGFVSPLDIPLLLSSNYGEYRAGHFHAGLDFKTQQVEGKNVFAVDSGYVYRIVVLLWSYGNAVYVKHPSGQITVYGHLSRFSPEVARYVREQQYRKKSYTLDIMPEPNKFIFKKGELIGLSGNSGGSFGAHLHFELRDETGSVPLNPMNYGFKIADKTSPRINWLAIYPHTPESYISGFSQPLFLQLKKRNNAYSLASDTLIVKGKLGIGIETYDFLDNSLNECGPASVEMSIDNRQVFYCKIDSIPFSESGYINSFYDYGEMLRSGRKMQKLFIDPNNKLAIYKTAIDRGIIEFSDTSVHSVRIVVEDSYRNQSVLSFHLRATNQIYSTVPVRDTLAVAKFSYDSANVFETSNIRIAIPEYALFNNLDFDYNEYSTDTAKFSLMHRVHNRYTPLLRPYVISIRTHRIPHRLHEKCMIVSLKAGNVWSSEGGDFKNGFVTARVKSFGQFMVTVDTVPPEIKPLKFNSGAKYAAGQTFSFSIADTLSGISKFNGFIDNEWALFEYDAKNDLLYYTVDKARLQKDRLHQLEIVVSDNKENIARFKDSFYY